MSSIKRYLNFKKENIYFKRIIKAVIRRLLDIPKSVSWYWPSGFSIKNRIRLRRFKNIHRGKRCFILANGPSLKNINFEYLKNEITIGMNRIYLMENVNGFKPNYLVCIAKKTQLLQFQKDYNNLELTCFFNWDCKNKFEKNNNQYFIKGSFSPRFQSNLTKRIGSGKSVTYTCIQIAFYMGFQEVYLIGKDHSYKTDARTGTFFTSNGKEDNHFIKGYYESGMVWDAPDYETEEFAYSLARTAFEKDGRKILDATIDGKLNVFEKVNYNDLFN